ncbi:sulfatase-like hydrolase/transferase [Actinoplanes bogorensis]|uniref:Sulfatase-like hydrolase/transferase n=1 Tax=Paractinoplanes bogorensis TaxID=1610840 RepID=A0ABS5YP01_9ACTN|nr:sulfatase-like hydrolase/transferase [Actinoplanes bogorensis]MBU2665150.1 sulfatase-like hydrolase/transferase [Actinoplanes bogorensis]
MPVRLRRLPAALLTVAAAALIVTALVVPDAIGRPKEGAFLPGAFLRLPIEAILAGAMVLALPARWRRKFAVVFGLGLGVLVVLKIANAGFRSVLGRRFDPVTDTPLLRDGYNALTETDGKTYANLVVAGAIVLTVVLIAALVLASLRLTRLAKDRELPTRRVLAGLSAVWVALALSGVTLFPNAPVASDSAIALLKSTVKQVPATIRDERQFAAAVGHDPYASVPAADLVSGLRGKDVVIGVVESFGHSSLTDPGMSAIMNPALAASQAKLEKAGFHARTGWLTSSTYGGGSWLAHGSFQSGLWITTQQRYDGMVSGDRLTLTRAFHQAGWQTAGIEPGNTTDWPEAGFYGYDQVLDSRTMGYHGPDFGWSRMPDQYVLNTFQQQVRAKATRPLMAEITLTSSHEPWTHVPQMLPWDRIGDGKAYESQVAGAPPRSELWADKVKTQLAYAQTLAYSVDALTSWAADFGDDDTVLIMFGDHQPMSRITGTGASHDIPISIIAKDPQVLDRIAGWNWSDGLKPAAGAPVWRMDQFRDKFFAAYGRSEGVALGPR